MIAFVLAHPATAAFAAYWLFMAFVSGMPEPSPVSSIAYKWLFHALNLIAANIPALLVRRFPALALLLPGLAPKADEPPEEPTNTP